MADRELMAAARKWVENKNAAAEQAKEVAETRKELKNLEAKIVQGMRAAGIDTLDVDGLVLEHKRALVATAAKKK